MKGSLILLMFLSVITVYADNNCKKCDIEKVKIVQTRYDSLTFDIVRDFLCTFDKSCNIDAEFSAASNGTLYRILENYMALYFQVLAKSKLDNNLLVKQIESPVHDLIDFQKIYNKVKEAAALPETKTEYLNALIIAANKIGLKIKE